MNGWQDSKRWADQFTPHIKSILGYLFIQEAPLAQDQRENTDLMFMLFDKRVAIRIRNIKDRAPFNRRNEWTIRVSRPSGIDTELTKMMAGWADYCLYGWGDETTKKVQAFTVFDLDATRAWIFQYVLDKQTLPGMIQQDKDGSATFLAICIDDMPLQCIICRRTHLKGDTENQ
jgi:hypothetical protein